MLIIQMFSIFLGHKLFVLLGRQFAYSHHMTDRSRESYAHGTGTQLIDAKFYGCAFATTFSNSVAYISRGNFDWPAEGSHYFATN